MIALEIALQVLGIIALILLIYVLVSVLQMLKKISPKLDSLLEIVTYYEKFKVVVVDFMEGPARSYINTAKTIFSFVAPLLTRGRKSK